MTEFVFTVYVDGSDQGATVSGRLRELCDAAGVPAQIDVVDVIADPGTAETANVIGTPTVVRESPKPRRRVIGALDDDRRVSVALGLDRVGDREPA